MNKYVEHPPLDEVLTKSNQYDDKDRPSSSKIESRMREQELAELKAAAIHRDDTIKWVMRTVNAFLIAMTVVMVVYFVSQWGRIPSSVIIALLTNTAATVLGLPLVIIRKLFKA